jgi:VanZ like family
MSAPPRSRRWVLWCLAAYALTAAVVLFSPVSYAVVVVAVAEWLGTQVGLTGFGSGWIEFAANIVMFVPLGLLLTLVFAHPWWGVVFALAASAAVELVQFVIPSRQPSLRDVLANVTGAAIGAGIAWLWVLRRREAAA